MDAPDRKSYFVLRTECERGANAVAEQFSVSVPLPLGPFLTALMAHPYDCSLSLLVFTLPVR